METEIRTTLKRVERHTKGEAGTLKHAADAIGLTYKDLVRRLKRSEEVSASGKVTCRSFLDVEELGRLAAYVGEYLGKPAPPGWPLYTFAQFDRDMHTVRAAIDAGRH